MYIDRAHIDYVFDQAALEEALDVDLDGALDSAAETEVIAQACETVYGWIGTKYPSLTPTSVTSATAPARLRRLAGVVAAWMVIGRSSKYLTKQYEQAEKDGLAIGEGKQPLVGYTREDLPDSLRRDVLRETRDADSVLADYGEPGPGTTTDPLQDNTYRANF